MAWAKKNPRVAGWWLVDWQSVVRHWRCPLAVAVVASSA